MFRFYIEAQWDESLLLDREEGNIIMTNRPLLQSAYLIAHHIIRSDDESLLVEVDSSGNGLAMAGLLKAYDIDSIISWKWDSYEDDEDFDEDDWAD